MLERLQALTAPWTRQLAGPGFGLTHRELEICDFVRRGRTTKEIAGLLRLAPSTVETHRRRLRKKLRIAGTGVSLFNWLAERDGPPRDNPAMPPD